jgi:hypothetical protein
MRSDLKADSSSIRKPNERQRAVLSLRKRIQEFRMARQASIAASQAMEIHFGLATIEALQAIQLESQSELQRQQQRQDKAIELGVSMLDPMAIQRLMVALRDQEIETATKSPQLRSKLAVLVGTTIACPYMPEFMTSPVCPPPILDPCEFINLAYAQRCDLLGLVYLRKNLTVETLDVARWMTDILTATPPATVTATAIPGVSLIRLLFSNRHQNEEAELRERLAMLDKSIIAMRSQIASEVDIAIEKQRSAAERYCNALERIQLWQTRIDQLREYGDKFKPLLEEESSAQHSWYQARAEAIQRQGDWHQALVELSLAVGSIP